MEKSTNNILLLNLLKKPVKLLNKNGANICWWNSFVQLFAATNNTAIINEMNKFISKHGCNDNIDNNNDNNDDNNKSYKLCWYCTMFKSFVEIMSNSNNIDYVNFPEFLFNIPKPIVDPKDKKKLLYHPMQP